LAQATVEMLVAVRLTIVTKRAAQIGHGEDRPNSPVEEEPRSDPALCAG